MRKALIPVLFPALFMGAAGSALADSGAASIQGGTDSVGAGAHASADGSTEILTGDSVPGAASVGLGGSMMLAGSVSVAGGVVSVSAEDTGQAVEDAVDGWFDEAVTVGDVIVRPQAAPLVPHDVTLRVEGE